MQFSVGFKIVNYEALLESSFGLSFDVPFEASAQLDTEFSLYANGSAQYGNARLPPLVSFGGVIPSGYGAGNVTLPSLYSSGEGGFYIPPEQEYGQAYIGFLSSSGLIVTSRSGDGDTEIPSLVSMGGEGNYGSGSAYFPALVSAGYDSGIEHTVDCTEPVFIIDGFDYVRDAIVTINEQGQIVDTITGTRIQINTILEEMALTETYQVLGSFIVSIDEEMEVTGATVYEGVLPSDSRVWVVNLDTGASTQYDDYGFNSFFEYDGDEYGVTEDGIYKLNTDAAAGSLVDFGRSDFGSPKLKRVPNVYIGASSDNELYLKVEADGSEYTYQARSYGDMTNHRVDPGRGLKGVYWNFTLIADDDFDLETVTFEPIPLSRKI